MRRFCQSENYVSLATLEFVLKEHKDLIVSVCVTEREFRLKLYTKYMEFFLGKTRKLLRIPSKSKYPFLYKFLTSLDSVTYTRLLHVEMVYSKKG